MSLDDFSIVFYKKIRSKYINVSKGKFILRPRPPQNQNHFDKNISILINMRARAKYELALKEDSI